MKKVSFLIIALTTLSFWSCEEINTISFQEDLSGFWRLQSGIFVIDEAFDEINPLAYLELNDDSSLAGFNSRNQLAGTFSFNNSNQITINASLTTRVVDTPWSSKFSEAIVNTFEYKIEDNQLILNALEGGQELVFKRISEATCQTARNDRSAFLNDSSDEFDLKDVKIVNGCLEIYGAYGGGCEDVKMELVGGEDYAESLPPKLSIRLLFEDNDYCEAYIHKRFYFDLKELQYSDYDELVLKLKYWKDNIIFDFGD